MSIVPPLASLFHGDVNIERGCDIDSFGYGDLTVYRNAYINGTDESFGPTSGTVIVAGGVGIGKSVNIGKDLQVLTGITNLTETHIDTTNGLFTVTGGNAVMISVGDASTFQVTGGNLNLISTNNTALLRGGLNSLDAIQIFASNSAGGVNVQSGQAGQIALTAGSGGIYGVTSSGNISLTANNASGYFTVNSSAGNQNLTFSLNGTTDSQVLIESAGTNATLPAIQVNTKNTAGNITISNNGGLGEGAIYELAGSGGYHLTTNTGGPIQITAQDAASYLVVNSTTANKNLTIAVNGATNSSLILQSEGTNPTQAILIQNTNTAGSISIYQPPSSAGGVFVHTGSDGLSADTQLGGGISLVANGAYSQFINQTTTDFQDLRIAVQGNTDSKLVLSSTGTGNQAITIAATGSTSGIFATAAGPIQINTSDSNNGIQIGTITQVPVRIGTTNSTTTIYGNLDVRGTTTTIESTVVQVSDNILELNSAPFGTADAGVALKRYQPANDTALGDVVSDTPEYTGTAQSGTSTSITLSNTDTALDDFYNGWWVKIISGTGTGQVRRIRSYNAITKVATIYTTADQTGILGSPIPIEGLDFSTAPDNTSVYGLYPCEFIIAMWDSSNKEYAIVCSPMISGSAFPTIAHYVDLHINNLTANALYINTINGATADRLIFVTLMDNSTTPVEMIDFPFNYGIYFVLVKPTTAASTRTHAIFAIGRLNNSNCGQVVRLIGVKGVNGDNLDIQWPANSFPQLLYRGAPGTGTQTQYSVKVITA